MKFALRTLLFVLAFSIEVRVAKAAFEEPRACLKSKAENCAIKTFEDEKLTLAFKTGDIVLDHSTAVILSSEKLVLVGGTVWVRAHEAITISTEFGDAKIEKGEFWVSRANDRMIVSAIDVPVDLLPRGAKQSMTIDPGLENFVGGVQKDGTAETGLPVAVPFAEHVARWARLYSGSQAQFEKQVESFHKTWVEAAKRAVEVHKTLLDRRVAAVEAEQRIIAEKKRKTEAENRELRQLFRKKALEDQ